jgi:hypothetical protein
MNFQSSEKEEDVQQSTFIDLKRKDKSEKTSTDSIQTKALPNDEFIEAINDDEEGAEYYCKCCKITVFSEMLSLHENSKSHLFEKNIAISSIQPQIYHCKICNTFYDNKKILDDHVGSKMHKENKEAE